VGEVWFVIRSETLVAVSSGNASEHDVEREKSLKDEARDVEPAYVLERFDDLIDLFEFSNKEAKTASAGEAR
jgi:hypothetical protein